MPSPNDRVLVKFPGVEGTAEVTRKQFEVVWQARGGEVAGEVDTTESDEAARMTAEADQQAEQASAEDGAARGGRRRR